MSRYSIYRIDHFDPALAGKERRRQLKIYALYSFLLVVLLIACIFLFNLEGPLFYSTYAYLFLIVYYLLTIRIRKQMKKTAVIGELEFTKGGMTKTLGDTSVHYDYSSVTGLELKKHFPNVWFKDSKSGYFSHILKITFADNNTESLVLADKPLEKKPDTSISETLTTLKKFIKAEITFK
jgi:hypothetical protein